VKYLITGGAGFIGSHLSDALVTRGDSVVILDNFTTGSKENLNKVAGSATVVSGDILDSALVSKLVSESDFVVH
jgi:UDP-glucose 4-epimerase